MDQHEVFGLSAISTDHDDSSPNSQFGVVPASRFSPVTVRVAQDCFLRLLTSVRAPLWNLQLMKSCTSKTCPLATREDTNKLATKTLLWQQKPWCSIRRQVAPNNSKWYVVCCAPRSRRCSRTLRRRRRMPVWRTMSCLVTNPSNNTANIRSRYCKPVPRSRRFKRN